VCLVPSWYLETVKNWNVEWSIQLQVPKFMKMFLWSDDESERPSPKFNVQVLVGIVKHLPRDRG
jgi:hypothetical protein